MANQFLSDLPKTGYAARFQLPWPPGGGRKARPRGNEKAYPAPKRPLTALARVQKARILARLREGAAYDEIPREEERLMAERVRQIVREALAQRLPTRTPTTPSCSLPAFGRR